MRLYGRDRAKSLVSEFLLRDERDGRLRNRKNPVLLFTGPRGIGKTALLTALQDRYPSVPHAYIDCEKAASNAREMLAQLAYDLNRQCGRYGTLPFPRLITGEIVITAKMELDPIDRNTARRQVTDLLERHKKTESALEDAVSTLLAGVVTPLTAHGAGDSATGEAIGEAVGDLAGKYVTKLLLGGLAANPRGRRILLGKGQEWYGDQGRGLGRNPLDALIDLRRMAARSGSDGGNRREVAEWLWAAFLADLQASFRDKGAIDRTYNCVVLLDNADTPAGRAFLTELVDARAKRAHEEPDPLTVIATSRGALARRVRGVDAIAELADASYDDYLQRGQTPAERAWYPIALPPLSWNDTSDMANALELRGDRPAATTAVHAFTGGHPGATAALFAALAERRSPAAEAKAPATAKAPAESQAPDESKAPMLLNVLRQPKAGGLSDDPETVETAIRNALLASAPKAAADLTTCAAARDKAAAERMAVASDNDLMEHLLGEEPALLSGEFWSAESAGGRATLQPLLRRLLLRRLAGRSADEPASWTQVHEWLGGKRKHPETGQPGQPGQAGTADAGTQEVVRLYHALALGEVEHVARELAARLATTDPAQWLRLTVRITAAPNRLDHAKEPAKQVRALTAWVDPHQLPIAPVARLVAYSWLGADPLNAPHWHWLLRQLALELEQIAPYSIDEGLSLLRSEAERYREIADVDTRWSEVEDFWMTRAAEL
jgi:hypothetical protein